VHQRRRGGSIDPDPFVDADGTAYLLWKSDDNALGGRTVLWIRQLRPDGLGFDGRAVKVLRAEPGRRGPLVEGPSLVLHGETYHLLYSTGRWESREYGVGHATAAGPTGPFTVSSRTGPWLHGQDGPGGQSVVRDAEGQLHLAYHAWLDGRVGYAAGGVRALHVDRLDLSRGVPTLRGVGPAASPPA
jgi:beta-xylosidase